MASSKKAIPRTVVESEPQVQAEQEKVDIKEALYSPRTIYCLLVNDAVSVETHAPVGDWFCRFEQFSEGGTASEFYPMLVRTSSGVRPLSGFQQMETLRSVAEYMHSHLSEQQPVALSLVSGNHKMMSLWISE